MSAALALNEPILVRPPPAQDAAASTRSGKLLGFIRKLIAYGYELADNIRRSNAAPAAAMYHFGTADLAQILRRITIGLLRAAALDARITKSAARIDSNPIGTFRTPPLVRAPRSATPATPRVATPDPWLGRYPTLEEIAEDVRRRQLGAVLADICRDLGITHDHPLWHHLCFAILENGGGALKLRTEEINRSLQYRDRSHDDDAWIAYCQSQPAQAATGPP